MLPVAWDGLTKTFPSSAFNPHAFARDIAMADELWKSDAIGAKRICRELWDERQSIGRKLILGRLELVANSGTRGAGGLSLRCAHFRSSAYCGIWIAGDRLSSWLVFCSAVPGWKGVAPYPSFSDIWQLSASGRPR